MLEHVGCTETTKAGMAKAIAAVVMVLVLIAAGVSLSGCGSSSSSGSSKSKDTATKEKVTYKKVSVGTLIKAVQKNPAKAAKKYEDKTLAITGYISNFDSHGDYIDINNGENDYSFVNIQCYLKDDKTKDKVLDYEKGDKVTVKGTCTDVGEVFGYSIDVASIKKVS